MIIMGIIVTTVGRMIMITIMIGMPVTSRAPISAEDSAMSTKRESILAALHARLTALPATALRADVLPERGPVAGLLILHYGEPGEPEVALSPLT